jgi:tripartite-type tricarboxylate transporter receptor subunit TctC
MNPGRRAVLKTCVFFSCALLSAAQAFAQVYPARPVRMIVPFPPGGGFDGIARPFSEKLASSIGQSVVVENRAGAAGNIGAEYAARAAPDGYTVLFANDFMATNPPMYASAGFDPLKDFVPISMVGTANTGLAIHPGVPAKDLKELIALSKKKAINFGTPGIGSLPHLVGEMFNLERTMQLVHVPYKGSGPAITDTMGGQIEMVMTTLSALAPHIRAGRLRGIAVLSPGRAQSMPDLPTFAEGGGPEINADIWYALFAPAGTPELALRKLHEATAGALGQPDLVERLRKAGYEPGASNAQAVSARLKTDLEKWTRVVREARIPRGE